MAWKVKPSFELPKGFELWEDEDVVELRYEGDCVGMFVPHTATPNRILKRCHEYVGDRGMVMK